ncbi:MAG: glucose-6-phosphate isomerase [Saprospiraceae bacterium]
MLPKINPTTTDSWTMLQQHYKKIRPIHMKDLFLDDIKRTEKYSIEFDGLYLDYSKNRIVEDTLPLLFSLARECKLDEAIKMMFSGKTINETEGRAVLHTALRDQEEKAIYVDGNDIKPDISLVLDQMNLFSEEVINGTWLGCTGKKITDIVNIGIGGSDLGPVMVTESLKHYSNHLNTHFVSNVDGTHIVETLKKVDVETTLFLIASKTFTTQETMANATTARTFFLEKVGSEEHIKKHFVAMSTNTEAVASFGIDPKNMFVFWDWVGGRYSLTSAIGLSVMLSIGPVRFKELLAGFYSMDRHFKESPLEQNIPVILALLGIWYVNFFDVSSEAILPYDQYLHRFAAYFQQANMESNGKNVDRSGQAVHYKTGPVIWGEPGTNGQHAFYQLIHQGTELIPCDFIAPAISLNPTGNHHTLLMSNFLAQSQALMKGKTKEEVENEYIASVKNVEQVKNIIPFKVFEGNRPSNSILVKKLDPHHVGMLISMYEHKIFVQGIIWNIFSFDQWGVELGKQLAGSILPVLEGKKDNINFDNSTKSLIEKWKSWNRSQE